ncbi:MAG TPA: hypothetical protein VKA46_07410 [Gemmataceae bacterium]|nr:hypothetical protein [Gemmataceae bacterium]
MTDLSVVEIDQKGPISTKGSLKLIQAGQGEVFGLDGRGELCAWNSTTKQWTDTGRMGKSFSVGRDDQGKDVAFLQVADNTIWCYTAQKTWVNTGGQLASFHAGQGEVYGLDGKGELYFYSLKNGWRNTGQSGTSFVVGKFSATGPDTVFLQKSDTSVWVYDQGKWLNTGGQLTSIQAAQGQVFGLDGKGTLWVYDAATKAWTNTGKAGVAFGLGTDAQGRNEVYLKDAGGARWEYDKGVWTEITGAKGQFLSPLPPGATGLAPGGYQLGLQAGAGDSMLWIQVSDGAGNFSDSWYYWLSGSNSLVKWTWSTSTTGYWIEVVQGGQWGWNSTSGFYFTWVAPGASQRSEVGYLNVARGYANPPVTYAPPGPAAQEVEDDNSTAYVLDAAGNLLTISGVDIHTCTVWQDGSGGWHVSNAQGASIANLAVVSGDPTVLVAASGARQVSNGAAGRTVTLLSNDGFSHLTFGL